MSESTMDCEGEDSVLRHLLALADHYRDEGARRQAMDIYWSLVDAYPREPEGGLARQRLVQMAALFDQEGMHRMARDIYQQLLDKGCENHVRA